MLCETDRNLFFDRVKGNNTAAARNQLTMETIYLPELAQSPERTHVINVQEHLTGLETLTLVKGQIQVTHQGNYLEVAGQAETIVTLACDRCLRHYNHRLLIEVRELIWLDAVGSQSPLTLTDQDLAPEQLVEALPPDGFFDPAQWLYEHACLALPVQQLCSQDCTGIPVQTKAAVLDQRWAALANLKRQLQP